MSNSSKIIRQFGSLTVHDSFNINSSRLTGVGEPVLDSDAATKSYVDIINDSTVAYIDTVVASVYTAGVGLTEVANEFSVNASQTQITALGNINTGTWSANVIGVPYGGTGLSSIPSNKFLVGNGTGSLISVSPIHYTNSTFVSESKILCSDITPANTSTTAALTISGGVYIDKNAVVKESITTANMYCDSLVSTFDITSSSSGFITSSCSSLIVTNATFGQLNLDNSTIGFIVTDSVSAGNIQIGDLSLESGILSITGGSLNLINATDINMTEGVISVYDGGIVASMSSILVSGSVLNVDGDFNVTGPSTIIGDISVTGASLNVSNGDINISGGNFNLIGGVFSSDVVFSDATFNNVVFTQDASGGSLVLSGIAEFADMICNGDVTVANNLLVEASMTVGTDILVGNDVNINGGATIGEGILVEGFCTFGNNILAKTNMTIGGYLLIEGQLTIGNGILVEAGGIVNLGDSTTDNLVVNYNTVMLDTTIGELNVSGDCSIQNLTLSGSCSLGSLYSGTLIKGHDLDVTNTTSVSCVMTSTTTSNLNANTITTGDLVVVGNSTQGVVYTLLTSTGNVYVSGSITAPSIICATGGTFGTVLVSEGTVGTLFSENLVVANGTIGDLVLTNITSGTLKSTYNTMSSVWITGVSSHGSLVTNSVSSANVFCPAATCGILLCNNLTTGTLSVYTGITSASLFVQGDVTSASIFTTNSVSVNNTSANISNINIETTNCTASRLVIDQDLSLGGVAFTTGIHSGSQFNVTATNITSTAIATIPTWSGTYIQSPTFITGTTLTTTRATTLHISGPPLEGVNNTFTHQSTMTLGYTPNQIGGNLSGQVMFEKSNGDAKCSIFVQDTTNKLVIANADVANSGGIGAYVAEGSTIQLCTVPNETDITPSTFVEFGVDTTTFHSTKGNAISIDNGGLFTRQLSRGVEAIPVVEGGTITMSHTSPSVIILKPGAALTNLTVNLPNSATTIDGMMISLSSLYGITNITIGNSYIGTTNLASQKSFCNLVSDGVWYQV